MATRNQIGLAVFRLRLLEASQAQESLADQAQDCAPVVEALGYYDLADHLRKLGQD